MGEENVTPQEVILSKIYLVRGQKVMLDKDLAELYNVETKVLKQAVKRNIDIFPSHFMFQLTKKEFESLRSQIVTSNNGRGGTRYLPMAFTEHGILQSANILNSKRAKLMSIYIIEVFVQMRELLSTSKDLLLKMEELEKRIGNQDHKINQLFQYLKQFIKENQSPRKQIGYKSPN
jgi:hypothetical protein